MASISKFIPSSMKSYINFHNFPSLSSVAPKVNLSTALSNAEKAIPSHLDEQLAQISFDDKGMPVLLKEGKDVLDLQTKQSIQTLMKKLNVNAYTEQQGVSRLTEASNKIAETCKSFFDKISTATSKLFNTITAPFRYVRDLFKKWFGKGEATQATETTQAEQTATTEATPSK